MGAPADEEEWEWQLAVARAKAAAESEDVKVFEAPTPVVSPPAYRPTTFAHAGPVRPPPAPQRATARRFPRASQHKAVAPLPWLPKPR